MLLKDVFRNCYLTTEGILNQEICVVEGTDNLLDALFCVHLQRQYSASRDLNAFLKQYENDVKKIEDESAKKYLLALQVNSFPRLKCIINVSLTNLHCRKDEKTRKN